MQRQTSLRMACALAAVSAIFFSLSPAQAGNSKGSKKTKNTVAKRNQVVLMAATNGYKVAPGFSISVNPSGVQNQSGWSTVLSTGTITLSGGNQLQGVAADQFNSQRFSGPILGANTAEINVGTARWGPPNPDLLVRGHNLSSNAGFGGFPMGLEVFPSNVPAGGAVRGSRVITGADASVQPSSNQVGTRPTSGFQAIGVRPDFQYEPDKLKFERLSTSDIKGQPGMNVAPATPQGTSRYVPLGEF